MVIYLPARMHSTGVVDCSV